MAFRNCITADIDNSTVLPIKEGSIHWSLVFSECVLFKGSGDLEILKSLFKGDGLGFFSRSFRRFQISLFCKRLEALSCLDVGDNFPPELGAIFRRDTLRLPAYSFGYSSSMPLVPDHITFIRSASMLPGLRLPITNPGMPRLCPFHLYKLPIFLEIFWRSPGILFTHFNEWLYKFRNKHTYIIFVYRDSFCLLWGNLRVAGYGAESIIWVEFSVPESTYSLHK